MNKLNLYASSGSNYIINVSINFNFATFRKGRIPLSELVEN